jgi:hypothetical protein
MHELNPLTAATAFDPYGYYARLVAERPMYRDEGRNLWRRSKPVDGRFQ